MKRQLLTIGIIFSLSLWVAVYFRTNILISASVAFLAMGVIFLKCKEKFLFFMKITVLTISFAFILTAFYNIFVINPFLKLSGRTIEVKGIIREIYKVNSTVYLKCKVKFENIKGTRKTAEVLIRSFQSEEGKEGETFSCEIEVDLPQGKNKIRRNMAGDINFTANLCGTMAKTDDNIFTVEKKILAFKSYIIKNLANSVDSSCFNLATALIMGDRAKLDRDLQGYLSTCGVMHMVAVSGMHMAIIADFFKVIFLSLGVNKRKANLFSIIPLWIYGSVCGFSPSVLRSAIMLSISLLAPVLFEKADTLNSIGFAAFITLCLNPYAVLNIGFQMSYLACLGISIISPPIEEFLKKFAFNSKLKALSQAFAHSLAAWFFVIPTSALCFNYLSILSPVVTVVLSPIIPLILGFGILCGITPQLSFIGYLGNLFGFVCSKLLSITIFVVKLFSKIPFAIIMLDSKWKVLWIFAFIIFLSLILLIKKSHLLWKTAIISLAIIFLTGTVTSKLFDFNNAEMIVSLEVLAIKQRDTAIVIELSEPVYSSYTIENPLWGVKNIPTVIMESEKQFETSALKELCEKTKVKTILAPNTKYVKNYLNVLSFNDYQELLPCEIEFGEIKVEYNKNKYAKITIGETLILKKYADYDIIDNMGDCNILIDEENEIYVFGNSHKNFTIIPRDYWNVINFNLE